MDEYRRECENYRRLNKIARKNGVVLFGSNFAREIPVCELKQTFDLECNIYNRSFTDLSVADAAELIEESVFSLNPDKILIQLGETDLQRGFLTIDQIIKSYSELISKIKNYNKNTEIIIISVCENESGVYPAEFNKALEKLAAENKCKYADISPAFSNELPGIKAFSMLKYYIIDTLSLYDIMNAVKI